MVVRPNEHTLASAVFSKSAVAYVVSILVTSLAISGPTIAWSALSPEPIPLWLETAFTILIVYAFIRLILVWPALAIGSGVWAVRGSWDATRGNVFWIFLILVPVLWPFLCVEFAVDAGGIVIEVDTLTSPDILERARLVALVQDLLLATLHLLARC